MSRVRVKVKARYDFQLGSGFGSDFSIRLWSELGCGIWVEWARARAGASVMDMFRSRDRAGVRARVRVRGGGISTHMHACKAGLASMRFSEGGRPLDEIERVVQQSTAK